MKKLYISTLFLLITLGVFGQYSISFNDTLRPFGSGAYGIENIIEDSLNYYTLGVYNSSNGQFPFILELDHYGQITNKKLYVDSSFAYAPYPYNALIKQNNKLLFCSPRWGTSAGTLGSVIAVDKYTLDTLWTKTYTHPDTLIVQTAQDVFSVLTAIKPAPDGGYILTGNYNKDCITGNLRSFLMKIDSVGNVEWRKTYDNFYTFFDIEVAPDSGYYVPSTYNGSDIYLTKFDKNGAFEWKIQSNSNSHDSYPADISILDNQNVVISSTFWYDVANYKRAITVAKINVISKTVVWENNYFPYYNFKCVSMHQAMGVETLPNGDIIVSGTAKNYGHDAVILKLNSNGDSLWCKSYDFDPDPWDCQLNDLIITEDGGFMGVGFFSDQNGPGWTAWMFKTDANGIVGFESEPSSASGSFAKIFPNPSLDYTTLSYDCKFAQMSFSIVDIQGRILINKPLKTIEDKDVNEVLIDLSSLSAGTYQILVNTNAKTIWSEKLIISK
jgi:hypothetical protein